MECPIFAGPFARRGYGDNAHPWTACNRGPARTSRFHTRADALQSGHVGAIPRPVVRKQCGKERAWRLAWHMTRW